MMCEGEKDLLRIRQQQFETWGVGCNGIITVYNPLQIIRWYNITCYGTKGRILEAMV